MTPCASAVRDIHRAFSKLHLGGIWWISSSQSEFQPLWGKKLVHCRSKTWGYFQVKSFLLATWGGYWILVKHRLVFLLTGVLKPFRGRFDFWTGFLNVSSWRVLYLRPARHGGLSKLLDLMTGKKPVALVYPVPFTTRVHLWRQFMLELLVFSYIYIISSFICLFIRNAIALSCMFTHIWYNVSII